MSDRRLLLVHEISPARDTRIVELRARGWDVIAADHQDLWWPKFVESTRWDAIVIDSSSLPLIMAEIASELGSSPANQETPLYLIGLPASEGANLPTPLRRAVILDDYTAIP
jgi:hypothetical protein